MFEKVFQFANEYVKKVLLEEKEERFVAEATDRIIKPVISNWYITEVILPALAFERQYYFRVSQMSRFFCPVEECFCAVNNIVRQRVLRFSEKYKMNLGIYTHNFLNEFLNDFLEGFWRCIKCGNVFTEPQPICSKCGGEVYYKLPEYYDDVFGIKGTPDGFFRKDSEKYLLEIKTVDFGLSEKRFNEAVLQLNLYMHLTNVYKGLLVIFSRVNPRDTEEYVVLYNPQLVSQLLEKVKIAWEYIKKGEVPWHLREKSCERRDCLASGECRIGGKF